MTSTMVAKVSPMGQMRQNTGKPKTAAESSEPPKMTWRESSAARFSAQEEQSSLEPQPLSAACSWAVRGADVLSSAFAAFTSGFSSAGKTPVPVMSVFDAFFEKMPRIFDTTGTGHTQPQKARANSRMRASAMTTEMTARGSRVFVGDHRRERAQGAQKRDVLPADGRQRAHAHMGGKAHADDADDGEGSGAESLGIHEGTSFTTRGDGR